MGRGTPLWGPYGVGDPPLWGECGGQIGVCGPLRGVLGSPCWVLGSLEGFWGLYGVLKNPLWVFVGPCGVSGVPMGLGTPNYGVNVEVKLGCVAL